MLFCGANGKVYRNVGVQIGGGLLRLKDTGSQCGESRGSYQRNQGSSTEINSNIWKDQNAYVTYDDLLRDVLVSKEVTINWLMEQKLIASKQECERCGNDMVLVKCEDRSDGFRWECRKQVSGRRHKFTVSIRKGSWFEESNLTIEEVLKYTYWWTQGLDQCQIRRQLRMSPNTAVDWDSFCRETCEVTMLDKSEKIGGVGKVVQIDESKVGKRKYHRGHRVEGQWVFGGIEEDSRRCFMVPVEDRSEATLVPIIKQWIEPGTLIVSDCWKSYSKLREHGYEHETVNHSKEFKNENGFDTNKQEGHWRHMKTSLPIFGTRKEHFTSYLAEFMWRYKYKNMDTFKVFLSDVKEIYKV